MAKSTVYNVTIVTQLQKIRKNTLRIVLEILLKKSIKRPFYRDFFPTYDKTDL